MGNSDFRIDVTRMKDMLRKLDECDDRMRGASKKLKKVGPKGLGTGGLDGACDEFQSEWDDGITRIADAAKKIHEQLSLTLEAYTATDDDNAKGFGKK
ncbi:MULTISPECIES: WXG100 family type VII secretion target [Streptomyces]|uniref:WXG100 family type VII secretion target n=3 Tax=Streptomyces TaxID=1883 RepID=A0A401W2D5_STREY|nr:hypothetical protein GKJPGBOP_03181 [Streptomyces paromomycinus]